MTPENRVRRKHRHGEDHAPKPKDSKSQGIVRDQRGQEQPADKERAQRASKTRPEQPGHSWRTIMRAGTIVTLAVLAFLLAGSVAFAYFGLSEPGRPMSSEFFVALILGSLLSMGVGVGLMALLFYSHRKGYDEPPRLLPPSN